MWANIQHCEQSLFIRNDSFRLADDVLFLNLFYSRFPPESRSKEQSRCYEILLYIYRLKGSFISFSLTKVNILFTPQNLPFQFDSFSSVWCLTSETVRRKSYITMHYHILHIAIFIPFASLSSVEKCTNLNTNRARWIVSITFEYLRNCSAQEKYVTKMKRKEKQ